MTESRVDEVQPKRRWQYLPVGTGILLTALVVGALVYFWEELQDAAGYGYAGCFVVTIMAGITIIPAPALPLVFTLGHKLSPVYVGLVAGLGEALGGITVYLTGAGGGAIWSKLRVRQENIYRQPSPGSDTSVLVPLELQARQRAFFNRLITPMRRWGGFWPVFISSAIVLSPFYVVALGAGALGMGLKRFFLVTWAGKTIKGLYVAFAGHWGLYFLLQWIGG